MGNFHSKRKTQETVEITWTKVGLQPSGIPLFSSIPTSSSLLFFIHDCPTFALKYVAVVSFL